MTKRGVIEIQFNWIFVLVVGAIILMFFFLFVQKQKGFAEERNAGRLMTDLEAIFVGAQVSKGASFPVDIPSIPIHFSCDENCLCTYEVSGVSRQYKDALIFAPDPLEGNSMILWSKEFKMPFRVINLLMLSSDKTKYYVIYDPDNAVSGQQKEVLEKNLPQNIQIEYFDSTQTDQVTFNNDPFTKIIILGEDTLTDFGNFIRLMNDRFEDKDVNVIVIKSNNEIDFHDKTRATANIPLQPTKTLPWFDETSIFAASFANNGQMYLCNMKNSLQRLSLVAPVLKERAEMLGQEDSLGRCTYESGISYLDDIQLQAGTLAGSNLVEDRVGLGISVQSLKNENQQKLQDNCPAIY